MLATPISVSALLIFLFSLSSVAQTPTKSLDISLGAKDHAVVELLNTGQIRIRYLNVRKDFETQNPQYLLQPVSPAVAKVYSFNRLIASEVFTLAEQLFAVVTDPSKGSDSPSYVVKIQMKRGVPRIRGTPFYLVVGLLSSLELELMIRSGFPPGGKWLASAAFVATSVGINFLFNANERRKNLIEASMIYLGNSSSDLLQVQSFRRDPWGGKITDVVLKSANGETHSLRSHALAFECSKILVL